MPEPAGPRAGVAGPVDGRPLRLLILGDSSAAGVGVDHQDQGLSGRLVSRLADAGYRVDWTLIAKIGAQTGDTIERLRAADIGPVDVVVLGLGVNDATHMVPERKWLRQTGTLMCLIRDKLGDPFVLVSGFPPIGRFPAMPQPLRAVLGWRAQLMDDLRQNSFDHMPRVVQMPFDMPLTQAHMALDGFHPGAVVYDEWAAVAADTWRAIQYPAIDPHDSKA